MDPQAGTGSAITERVSTVRESCRECAIGRVSGEGQGSFCPFITRSYRAGDTLYRQGDEAGYVWFVRSGSVQLERTQPGDRPPSAATDCAGERKPAGSFVGLESLVRARYDATAQVAEDAVLCGASRAGFAQWLGPNSERTCALLDTLLPTSSD